MSIFRRRTSIESIRTLPRVLRERGAILSGNIAMGHVCFQLFAAINANSAGDSGQHNRRTNTNRAGKKVNSFISIRIAREAEHISYVNIYLRSEHTDMIRYVSR